MPFWSVSVSFYAHSAYVDCRPSPNNFVTWRSHRKPFAGKRKAWNDSHNDWKESNPARVPKVLEVKQVWTPVKVSFDLAGSDTEQSFDLLTAIFLFPERQFLGFLSKPCSGNFAQRCVLSLFSNVKNKVVYVPQQLSNETIWRLVIIPEIQFLRLFTPEHIMRHV